jgi:hypothetical protein
LHVAAQIGNPVITRLLLEGKASVNAVMKQKTIEYAARICIHCRFNILSILPQFACALNYAHPQLHFQQRIDVSSKGSARGTLEP